MESFILIFTNMFWLHYKKKYYGIIYFSFYKYVFLFIIKKKKSTMASFILYNYNKYIFVNIFFIGIFLIK